MKKIIFSAAIALSAVVFSSCDDFLNDNRFPLDKESDLPEYWNNELTVKLQCDSLYNVFTGYGSGTNGLFYFTTLSDDQGGAIDNKFSNWKYTTVPASDNNWKNPYKYIRSTNAIIERLKTSTLKEDLVAKYTGIARLIRGLQYFWLVRAYGDVPYYDFVIDESDTKALQKARDNRDEVMDKVLEDLKYAVENIGNGSKTTYSSDMAKAMLADIALWEGTYCKYRTAEENGYAADPARAEKYLKECVTACESLMGGNYYLNASYQGNYNSPEAELDKNPEMIFYKQYKATVLTQSVINYLTQTTAIAGISKDAFDSYLFKDGKPLALTAMNKDDAGYVKKGIVTGTGSDAVIGDELYIGDLLDLRDKRLSETVDTVVGFGTSKVGMTWARYGSRQLSSNTAYLIRKYDNISIPWTFRASGNYTSAPIFWLSVVYLNYAEAKAELGTLTDNDLNASINKLYTRAELPVQTVASLSNMNDPANNMNVSSLIWEIRRCRRCELIMDNDFRYWDMIRWHQLDKLDTSKYPNIRLGANLKNSPVQLSNMEGDYINAIPGNNRIFQPRYYLFPIPSSQITLNPNLTQQPLWK